MNKKIKYNSFLKDISNIIPQKRIYTDDLRRLAWGTDAGFYRLIPQIVIRSDNEQEIAQLLQIADRYELPFTFRAAGTSLSGQSISDSILIIAGKNWEKYQISPDHEQITMQPGLIGQHINELLAPFGRKFAPDPASINSSMLGGIVMNNASGMSCGTHANSDKMLLSAKMVLADGTILDTGNEESRQSFAQTHPDFIKEIEALRDEVLADAKLTERIRYKYSIKNVTGLNIYPLVNFIDPFDIITHLLVGSEGTLAFLSEVTMKTAPIYPFRASALIYFNDIKEAARAVVAIKKMNVSAAELLDKKSLASVNDTTGEGLTAVLTETQALSEKELKENIAAIQEALKPYPTFIPIHFTDDPMIYSKYWAIRAGIFPAVGGTRHLGTTCLIEDIAFHIENLPEAAADLAELLEKHGYDDSCIYGHALEGNFHFIINQSFDTDKEIERYKSLILDVVKMVVDKYDGSLKAEHGTGRNMAPFVKYEWGEKAFSLMCRIKKLFDPKGLINPGVIFNDDPLCYLKNFKPLPVLKPEGELDEDSERIYAKLNKCIECGFCEMNCLTCGFSLSSRTRIVLQREIARLKQKNDNPQRLDTLQRQYAYLGNQTCAGDGLCSVSCPMGINVGDLTHEIRRTLLPKHSIGYKTGNYVAKHFAGIKSGMHFSLEAADMGHMLLGTKMMNYVAKDLHEIAKLPLWTPAMPKAYQIPRIPQISQPLKVVYFPSCINQSMGLARKSPVRRPLVEEMCALLHKANYEVIFPKDMNKLCCGTIWESKGMPDIADRKTAELEEALWIASEEGKYPVICDQSPCLHRMRQKITKMKLYEPVEFIYRFLRDKLEFKQIDRPVAVHITCSMRLMEIGDTLVQLAQLCSSHILVPKEVGCCGFAGDKGFTHPEVNAYALRKLRPQIEKEKIEIGYSNSRTCEIGLTNNSGVPYVSIVYLVNECTTPLQKTNLE
jgi:D-lactate dehydrogenase